jgi:hypothetical protein
VRGKIRDFSPPQLCPANLCTTLWRLPAAEGAAVSFYSLCEADEEPDWNWSFHEAPALGPPGAPPPPAAAADEPDIFPNLHLQLEGEMELA